MVIIKSHSVQINMIPGRSWFRRKPFRGSSLKQELPQKGFSLWTKYSKSIKTHIWYIVFSSHYNDLEENASVGALWHVWENTNQELPQKGFSPWTKCSKTVQTLIFDRATLIIKSHSVQINTDPRKTWNKNLPWELFEIKNCYRKVLHCGRNMEKTINTSKVFFLNGIKPFHGSSLKSRTATERFFTVDRIWQNYQNT